MIYGPEMIPAHPVTMGLLLSTSNLLQSPLHLRIAGVWSLGKVALGYLLWLLIILELFLASSITFSRIVLCCLSPLHGWQASREARMQFSALFRDGTITSWELFKTASHYTPQQLAKNARRAKDLKEHSGCYRVFYHVLQ